MVVATTGKDKQLLMDTNSKIVRRSVPATMVITNVNSLTTTAVSPVADDTANAKKRTDLSSIVDKVFQIAMKNANAMMGHSNAILIKRVFAFTDKAVPVNRIKIVGSAEPTMAKLFLTATQKRTVTPAVPVTTVITTVNNMIKMTVDQVAIVTVLVKKKMVKLSTAVTSIETVTKNVPVPTVL